MTTGTDPTTGHVSVSHVLEVIQHGIRELDLPEPAHRSITDHTIQLELRSPGDLDQWQRHLGMQKAQWLPDGQYATGELRARGGWCEASWVSLYCWAVGR